MHLRYQRASQMTWPGGWVASGVSQVHAKQDLLRCIMTQYRKARIACDAQEAPTLTYMQSDQAYWLWVLRWVSNLPDAVPGWGWIAWRSNFLKRCRTDGFGNGFRYHSKDKQRLQGEIPGCGARLSNFASLIKAFFRRYAPGTLRQLL